MEYILIGADDEAKLEDEVNKAIKKGWEPQGGIAAATEEGRIFFFQAMVR